MKDTQKLALTVFLAGLTAFFYFGAEILAKHTAWTDFQTPVGMSDIFGLFASVCFAVGGALGMDTIGILRKVTGNTTSRSTD